MPTTLFLVSDGTLNVPAVMTLVERDSDLPHAIEVMKRLIQARGGDPEQVVVNPVGSRQQITP